MKYSPAPAPDWMGGVKSLGEFVARELRNVANAIGSSIELPTSFKEPPNAPDGTIAYADGTQWNPGSGAGFYGKEAGAWVKL